MSRYFILLLFVLMSACTTSHQEEVALSASTNTPSPSASSSPPTVLKPTATPSPMATAIPTEEAPTATATSIPITPEVVPMVVVSAGSFMMGIDAPYFVGEAEQSPSYEVYLDEFYLDQYEVTVAQFVLFLNALGRHSAACDDQDCVRLEDESPIEGIEGRYRSMDGKEMFPIQATWAGAQAYCEWVGKRLPTEAEWEKAARGTDARQYPWGYELLSTEEVGKWFSLAAVGSHPADVSPYQVFDLYGNAREWTQDWYQRTYDSDEPLNNPLGAAENNFLHKNIRSGVPLPSYVTYRSSLEISQEAGFRCAVSTSPLPTPTVPSPTLTPTRAPTVTPALPPSLSPTPTLTPTPTAPLTPISAQEVPMVVVPAGEFLMGSTLEQVRAWNEEWEKYNREIYSLDLSYLYAFID